MSRRRRERAAMGRKLSKFERETGYRLMPWQKDFLKELAAFQGRYR